MTVVAPIYLPTELDRVFGLFHAPEPGATLRTSVLICAPWGWDEVASYRTRRRWAERLAVAGHPTLRFDLPATGDSAGMPAAPARLESWLAAIAASAAWLRENGGAPRLAVIGLGLGGLLALESVARGTPIEELVLWGTPTSGRSFVRETHVFSKLQTGRSGDEGPGSGLPAGWLEAGGFVLSAETLDSLKSLDPQLLPSSPLRRALLLGRDGIEPDRGLHERLGQAGVETDIGLGVGWGRMVEHPERTELSEDSAERVELWLDSVAATTPERAAVENSPSADPESESGPATIELEVDGVGVRESSILVRQSFGNSFGVLAEPADAAPAGLCGVLLNAGAIRHIGPSRLWVETARRWAARGVPTLRVDLEGIGEADGDEGKRREIEAFYGSDFEQQIESVLDALEQRGFGTRFLLAGLCAGGYWSFRAALRDPRVETAVLLNAGALTWRDDLLKDRDALRFNRAFQMRWWVKLFRGEIRRPGLADIAPLATARLRSLGQYLRRRLLGGSVAPGATEIGDALDLLRASGAQLVLAFSADEELHAELKAEGILDRLNSWPSVALYDLPGRDHTLRSVGAQVAAAELLDRELDRAVSG
jgi:pimeloyl-ACP methyl ester carboxylesterase